MTSLRDKKKNLKTGAVSFTLVCDHEDFTDIEKALSAVEDRFLPPAHHDDAELLSRRLAQICRDWMEADVPS